MGGKRDLEGGGWGRDNRHHAVDPSGALFIKTLLNRIAKFKSFVFANFWLERRIGQGECLIVDVRPRKNSKTLCGCCGQPAPRYDREQKPREFEYIPLWDFKVFLRYRMRRVQCPNCGVKVEAVPWAEGKSRLCTSYKIFLARWARRLSWKETADVFHTNWHCVYRAVDWVVRWGLERRDLSGITAIGVDEFHVGGRRFITILYQIDQGMRRILGVANGKSKESLEELIFDLETHVASIRFVCSDMSSAYLSVIRRLLGEAVHVLDRFHIVQALNKALDKVRAAEVKELGKAGAAPLKNSKYCFLKNPQNLTQNQKLKLRDLVKLGFRTVRAYQYKEMFQALWTYNHPAWARKFLQAWCRQVMRSRIGPLKTFARSMRRHENLIMNYFEARKQFSSGVVEGLNRRINLITRKSYGFRSDEIRKTALFHALGRLPEPQFTHRFC